MTRHYILWGRKQNSIKEVKKMPYRTENIKVVGNEEEICADKIPEVDIIPLARWILEQMKYKENKTA